MFPATEKIETVDHFPRREWLPPRSSAADIQSRASEAGQRNLSLPSDLPTDVFGLDTWKQIYLSEVGTDVPRLPTETSGELPLSMILLERPKIAELTDASNKIIALIVSDSNIAPKILVLPTNIERSTSGAGRRKQIVGRFLNVQSGADATAPVSTNPLVAQIASERSRAHIDDECVAVADAALDDAVTLIQESNLGGAPSVIFSKDGILSLQWQKGKYGVAIIFAGDGLASIAFRRPGQFYAENGIEVAVTNDLPQSFNDALAAVLR